MWAKSETTNIVLIAGGTIAVLYLINNTGAEVAGGVSTGAELAGGGLGLAILAVPFLLLL